MKFPHHEVVLKIMQNCPKIGKLAFFSNLSRLLWTPIHEMETAHFVSCKIFQAAAFICPGQAAADSSRTTISFKTVHLCRHRVTLGGEWRENAAAPRKKSSRKKGRLLLQSSHNEPTMTIARYVHGKFIHSVQKRWRALKLRSTKVELEGTLSHN